MSAPVDRKIAIATGILGKATETGVRRHVNLLFGGRTVVLTERRETGFQSPRPTFVDADAGGAGGALERGLGRGINSLRYGCSGVPFGSRRRMLEQFLRAQGVAAILAEFGHIGANLAPVGQALGIPVFCYFRGFDASKRLRSPRIVRRYRAAMPRLAGVVSVSRSLLDNLASAGIVHPRTAVIPTGVDVETFAPGAKDPNLSAGRWTDRRQEGADDQPWRPSRRSRRTSPPTVWRSSATDRCGPRPKRAQRRWASTAASFSTG